MQSHTFERADLVETHIKPGLAESKSASKERKYDLVLCFTN
jgi:hypothetical protein